MKRSQINEAIKRAKARLAEFNISLPSFGYWSPKEWAENRERTEVIRERMLGWDVTDFGEGDFDRLGAVLFTVRNGDKNDPSLKQPYAEKYIIADDRLGQSLPIHYHIYKTEDIINRAGGVLVVRLWHKAEDGSLDRKSDVDVFMDGIKYTVHAGEEIEILPGNSVTIEPFIYHSLGAKQGAGYLVVGEVSKVNNDNTDNVFAEPLKRFTGIEEDAEPIHPLVNEYV